MARWQPNARLRLEEAALQLYAERGFDHTTVAEIAERAGLTERTFFRHFADKREVLFWGQSTLMQEIVDGIAAAPGSMTPIDAVAAALKRGGAVFDTRRERARQRRAVIAANPALHERELSKLATLADAITEALSARGVAATTARLTAETGVAMFKVAFERWVADPADPDFGAVVDASLRELKSLTGPP
ncbi:TetR family transcriptional regulator [Mycolicibacterium palauense]|uniref:TetR family transcriptional regulator n=1 Tax=Mycolicibacterium palauense TaxID=2034511 RepID=UPI000BFF000E|nr:TetR family transcriptional regulator [Mycolicibacterium palauense]